MDAFSSSLISSRSSGFHFVSGSSLKLEDQHFRPSNLLINPTCGDKARSLKSKTSLTIRASNDYERQDSGSNFLGGFVLGGIIVGALGCIYAPQISKALARTDSKDLMKKLPKFIYDEEKALERTRRILSEKISQLNTAIDDVSSQLHADDEPNGVAVSPEELEAST
ncbi:uncharacterized protein LOC124921394 [Impatiens glandulifera]|uniref:uncharacterized protein LOC124921394 n=1 Tax=Impatiens glandulifera TaxID=253017 RepID=UPI001FB06829|nr:uncharacterized protein LOC124921394 [Impatiens glandulifera]